MSATTIALPDRDVVPRPIDLVRLATFALAVTCAVWRAAVGAGLPLAAWPYIVVDLLLAVCQGFWAWRFAASGGRRSYVVGCVIVALPLGVSIGLSVAAAAGAFGAPLALGPAEVVAFILNLALLGLTLLGALGAPANRAVRSYAGAAIALAALGITALVGGLTHQHPLAVHASRAGGALPVASGPVFFCHLI